MSKEINFSNYLLYTGENNRYHNTGTILSEEVYIYIMNKWTALVIVCIWLSAALSVIFGGLDAIPFVFAVFGTLLVAAVY